MCKFKLPEKAKMGEVKASMENGMLIITMSIEEVKKHEVEAIEISN